MKTVITFEVETEDLSSFTDEYLAQLWHIGQANPNPFDDVEACHLAEYIGREIIVRWLASQRPALWTHQGRHLATVVKKGGAA